MQRQKMGGIEHSCGEHGEAELLGAVLWGHINLLPGLFSHLKFLASQINDKGLEDTEQGGKDNLRNWSAVWFLFLSLGNFNLF